MFSEILRFDLTRHVREPLFWVSAALFFLIALLVVSVGAIAADLGGAGGGVHRNAPYVVMMSLLQFSALAAFIGTAFVAGAIVRDHEHGMEEIVFAAPITKPAYVLGRFSGALAAVLLLFVFAVAAFALGPVLPWVDPAELGPPRAWPYAYSFLVLVLPNVVLFSAIAFAAATETRSMMYSYVAVIALLVGYVLSRNLVGQLGGEGLAALLDPTGIAPFADATRYWTTAERNSRVIPLEGAFLLNRALWLGMGLGLLAAAYARFSFTVTGSGKRASRRVRERVRPVRASSPAVAPSFVSRTHTPVEPTFGWAASGRQLLHRIGFELTGVVRSVPFLVILGLGMVVLIGNTQSLEQFMGGMRPIPVTRLMVEVVDFFGLYVLILLVLYSAELIWRERSAGMAGLTDAMPAPTWVFWGGKLGALAGIIVITLLAAMAVGIGAQLTRGYTDLEVGLYLRDLFLVKGTAFLHVAVLALLVQVLVDHRFAGYLALVGVVLGLVLLRTLGVEHELFYPMGPLPWVMYSDMNGYGPFAEPLAWLYGYRSILAVAFLILVHLFWVRGRETGARHRLALAAGRWTPRVRTVAVCTTAAFLGVGSWIFYNTNVLNEYFPSQRVEETRAAYEREYSRYRTTPQPVITAVRAEVDIYPHRRALEIRGTYRLRNETDEPIDAVHVTTNPFLSATTEVRIDGSTAGHTDEVLGYSVRELDRPLAPGDEVEMEFRTTLQRRGFRVGALTLPYSADVNTHIVENGSFIHSGFYFPSIGYERAWELRELETRRRHDLGDWEPPLGPDDPAARLRAFADAGWIDFETIVSTSEDQVALAPGDLVREWREDGRRYFHYRVDHPFEPLWVYLSGRWEVARGDWNGVEISVYHHEGHPYNVQGMIEAAKLALDTYSRSFGPHSEQVLRIVEFPRYAPIAESHSTQVLISESAGFIADADRGSGLIDQVLRITAHEVAHEWWGNSLLAANARGRMMVIESLAEYSALMAIQRRDGTEGVRGYRRWARDFYLRGRAEARTPERPLVSVEDDQQYVAYVKGALALHALADQFGEERVTGALARFHSDHAFSGPPFPTSRDLLGYLEAFVPADRRGVLEDWFETITLWDLRTAGARATRREDGRFAVQIDVEARKFRAEDNGAERDVPMDDWVDIAVFSRPGPGDPPEGRILYLEKHHIDAPAMTLEVVVDEAPERAGIDPYHKLIDRNPDDNVAAVQAAAR